MLCLICGNLDIGRKYIGTKPVMEVEGRLGLLHRGYINSSSHSTISTRSLSQRGPSTHLESHGVGSSQKYPQRQLGLVRPVAP